MNEVLPFYCLYCRLAGSPDPGTTCLADGWNFQHLRHDRSYKNCEIGDLLAHHSPYTWHYTCQDSKWLEARHLVQPALARLSRSGRQENLQSLQNRILCIEDATRLKTKQPEAFKLCAEHMLQHSCKALKACLVTWRHSLEHEIRLTKVFDAMILGGSVDPFSNWVVQGCRPSWLHSFHCSCAFVACTKAREYRSFFRPFEAQKCSNVGNWWQLYVFKFLSHR